MGAMKALLEQDVCEGDDPPLIGGELADQLRAERFDTPPLFFGVYDLVEVEDIGQRVAPLLPRFRPGNSGRCRQIARRNACGESYFSARVDPLMR